MGRPPRIDVAVIGGGIIGLSSAIELARAGRDVRVFARERDADRASTRNAGQIRPDACVPLAAPGAVREALRAGTIQRGRPVRLGVAALRNWRWLAAFAKWSRGHDLERRTRALAALGKESLEAFTTWERLAGAPLLIRRGAVDVFETEEALAASESRLRYAADLGFANERLTATQTHRAVSGCAADVAGGVLFSAAAHCDPARLLDVLRRIAHEAGVEFSSSGEVLSISATGKGAIVRTRTSQVTAELVVAAAGERTPALFRDRDAEQLPILRGRGYGVDVETTSELPVPLILVERHIAITPLRSGVMRLTSGMELGISGSRLGGGRRRALLAQTARLFPRMSLRRIDGWSAGRPMTPDGLPIVGFIDGRRRVVVASGHGMLGVTHGPGTGRLVATLIAGDAPPWATSFSPARFAAGWGPS